MLLLSFDLIYLPYVFREIIGTLCALGVKYRPISLRSPCFSQQHFIKLNCYPFHIFQFWYYFRRMLIWECATLNIKRSEDLDCILNEIKISGSITNIYHIVSNVLNYAVRFVLVFKIESLLFLSVLFQIILNHFTLFYLVKHFFFCHYTVEVLKFSVLC